MRICYNCFQEAEDSSLFCENCGNRLGISNESIFPDALACGTTLYGRYLVGRVLGQDSLYFLYIAQDSRTKETVVLREYFPKAVSARSSYRSVVAQEEKRGAFQQGKELFLEEAETLSDLAEDTDAAGLQSFFSQNDTVYEAIRYTDRESLWKYLEKADGMQFHREAEQLLNPGAAETGSPADGTEPGGAVFPENLPQDSGSTAAGESARRGEAVSAAAAPDAPAAEAAGTTGAVSGGLNAEIPENAGTPENAEIHETAGVPETAEIPETAGVPENAEISETAGPVPGSGGKTEAHEGKKSAPDIREPAEIPERTEMFPGSDASAEMPEKTEGFPGDDASAEIPEKTEMFPGSDASAEKPERTEMIPGDDASAVIPGKPGIPPAAGSGRPGTGGRGGKKKSSALPALAGMLVLMAVAAAVVVLLFNSLSGIIGRFTHEYALRKKAEKIWEITRDRITEKEKKTNIETNAETKTEGISSGNYYNCGYFAFCDGDLYYISSEGLFRCEGADPENAERIASDGPRYLNCRNGCLYYLTEFTDEIRRYDPEQNRETTLFDAAGAPDFSPTSLYIWENWCYFAHKMHLYRISMETLDSGTAGPEDAELIAEDYNAGNHVFPSICFLDGEIYYNGSLGLRRTSPAGTKKETVSTELNRNGNLITDGTSVFSWYGVYDVYRIETGGESEKLPFPDREARICKFNYCDDRLYYVMDDGEEYSLWQTDRDGTEAECLQSIGSSQDIIVSFCVFPGEKYAYCYRMRKGDDALESVIEKYPLQ